MICADGCSSSFHRSRVRALAGSLDPQFHGRPPARLLGIRERGLAEEEEIAAEHALLAGCTPTKR